MSLDKILSDTTSKFQDAVNCNRTIPDHLRKQVDAIYEMETDFNHGLANLSDGIQAECDYLEDLWKKSFTTPK